MALVIVADVCTGCKSCVPVCSEKAISVDGETFCLAIDPHRCTECKACQAVCPTGCIQAGG